jgi:hypothetical protein
MKHAGRHLRCTPLPIICSPSPPGPGMELANSSCCCCWWWCRMVRRRLWMDCTAASSAASSSPPPALADGRYTPTSDAVRRWGETLGGRASAVASRAAASRLAWNNEPLPAARGPAPGVLPPSSSSAVSYAGSPSPSSSCSQAYAEGAYIFWEPAAFGASQWVERSGHRLLPQRAAAGGSHPKPVSFLQSHPTHRTKPPGRT